MIELGTRVIVRISHEALDGSFGCDRGRKLVIKLLRNDLIEIRPFGTYRPVRGTVMELYRYLVRRAANAHLLEKTRLKKERKSIRLVRERQRRVEKKLFAKESN